jgi:hypothetical protein
MDKEMYNLFNGDARNFHKQRRMFVIKNNQLIIAPENVDYSHAEWFRLLGWLNEDNALDLMNSLVRGYVDETGIYFYKGYTFFIDEDAKESFFRFVNELNNLLKFNSNLHVFGGLNLISPGIAEPINDFGEVSSLLFK